MPRNGRKGKGGGRKVSRTVTVVAPSEAIERSLATRQDSTNLQGKFLLTSNLASSGVTAIAIFNPASLGVRASALSALFANYRFKYIALKFFFTNVTPPGGVCAVGVLDDFTGEGDAPTSIGGVLELRCSATAFASQTTPTEMLWKPTSQAWRFVTSGASGSDQRLVSPATLYACTNIAGQLVTEIMFSCTFKGAVDVGAS